MLSHALASALDGKGSALMQLADAYTAQLRRHLRQQLIEAIYAISCLDDPTG